MLLGVIADDFTGATDIAGFLVANGLATTQLIGVPDSGINVEAEAVVISLKSRSCPAQEAIAESLQALEWLRAKGCKRIFQKYCSTFDSSKEGNIGPVADALLDALEDNLTVVCPALPINGRTIYNGYLFVNGVLLEESGMRNHPITPMTDSSLIRLMEAQSAGKCGVVPAEVINLGAQAVKDALEEARRQGNRYMVLDAITDEHLDIVGEAVKDMALVTGGSGLGAGIARALKQPDKADAEEAAKAGAAQPGRGVVLAGSCSTMTNQQVALYKAEAPSHIVEPERCMEDAEAYGKELAAWVLEQPSDPDSLSPMLHATADPDTLHAIQQKYGAEASKAIERTFATVSGILAEKGVTRFVVAGGETSGAAVKALELSGFAIGPQIAPGVPWVRAIDKPYSLALKSGNFGAPSFFFDCQTPEALAKLGRSGESEGK
nr:3-oxo-tetronate kinase [uncultured Cohaesibacter sp.]